MSASKGNVYDVYFPVISSNFSTLSQSLRVLFWVHLGIRGRSPRCPRLIYASIFGGQTCEALIGSPPDMGPSTIIRPNDVIRVLLNDSYLAREYDINRYPWVWDLFIYCLGRSLLL